MDDVKSNTSYEINGSDFSSIIQMIIFSSLGIFIFFFPLKIKGEMITPIIYIYEYIELTQEKFIYLYIFIFIALFAVRLYFDKQKDFKSTLDMVIKFISLLIVILLIFDKTSILFANEKIAIIMKESLFRLSILLPLAGVFLPFLLEYGVLYIVDGCFQKPMKKIFKLSGKSILIFALFVFVDNFIGCYIVYKLFKEGKLRMRECESDLLNFSIINIPIIIYMAQALKLDLIFLLICEIAVLCITNMIVCRIYPISNVDNSFLKKSTYKERGYKKNKFKMCVITYLKNKEEKKIITYIKEYFSESLSIVINIAPILIFSFFIMDFLLRDKILFSIVVSIYKKFIDLLRLPNSSYISNYLVLGLLNQTYPISVVVKDLQLISRLIISVITISQGISLTSNLIFLRLYIPDISYKDIVLIYIERVVIMILIIFLFYYFYLGFTS